MGRSMSEGYDGWEVHEDETGEVLGTHLTREQAEQLVAEGTQEPAPEEAQPELPLETTTETQAGPDASNEPAEGEGETASEEPA